MSASVSQKIINSRLLAMLFVGFASGLPLALTGTTLQAWLTNAHVNLMVIGALSLVGLPYTLKFLWAPLMDYFHWPRLGKRKGWMLSMQFFVGVALLILANINPTQHAQIIAIVALSVAFFSASQDIAVDAYRADVLKPEERGLGASYFVFAYRMAMLVTGGLALVCADYLGWKITYQIMAGLMFLSMLPTYYAPSINEPKSDPNLLKTILAALTDLLQKDKIILLILFVIFYKFGDALALTLMTNFLLHGLGFTLTEVGLVYKIMSIVAIILGGFAGGLLLLRWNIFYALLIFGIAQACSNLAFAALAIVGKNFGLMAASVFLENFCSGLSTAAFLAFLMSLCDRRFSASQFAILSAFASLGRVFLGPIAVLMVENFGWTQLYILSFISCFPGIIFLLMLKDKVTQYAPAGAD